MRPSGVHLLLTYQCTLECDHCFVWGSPKQTGTMSLETVRAILRQAKEAGVRTIYFEGGEPFLYYGLLREGVRTAARMGFDVGIVSNGYWATKVDDAVAWLRPFRGRLMDLSISSDLYHWSAEQAFLAENVREAARRLGIPIGLISIAQPRAANAPSGVGQLPPGESAIMYRGRAAARLAARAPTHPWSAFTACPYENLRAPGRVHVDPFGYVHVCDGIAVGNVFERRLKGIFAEYEPESHPIAGPLLAGGPAELVRRRHVRHRQRYADACHLCYEARGMLRRQFPAVLAPDQMYGVAGS